MPLELQTLQQRIPFGPANDPAQCKPWNPPVSQFNLAWLKSSFVPFQRDRLAKVMAAIEDANKEIEKLRAGGTQPEVIGDRMANGIVLRSGIEQVMQRERRTVAQKQLLNSIIELRKPLDKIVTPILRDMERASHTAETLAERVFNKESCLARATLTSAGDRASFAALKANYAVMLKGLAPIELFYMAQRCLDDGSPEALPLLDSIRVENFGRSKSDRAFLNAALLALAVVPEFNEAQPLLEEVKQCHKQALLAWAAFANATNGVSTMKIAMGLNKFNVKDPDPNDPYQDLG